MMLEAVQVPLSRVFSSDYEFNIPRYQRPYTWGVEEATQLLDDLTEAMGRAKEDDPYFLGSLVLIKEHGKPDAQVIDGQQRLTTLTILFAVLRELSSGVQVAELDNFVWEPGNSILGLVDRPRLRLRPLDEDFFRKHVQERGGLAVLESGVTPENDAQQRVADNARRLAKELRSWDPGERGRLAGMMARHAVLVVVSTPDLTSAYRIFSVMNSRGVELKPHDIFKAEIIGALPEGERNKYAAKWEDLEADFGVEAFNELFSHLRMIYAKVRLRTQLLGEFQDHVLNAFLPDRPAVFVDDVLERYGKAFRAALRCDYESENDEQGDTEVNRWLHRLNRLNNFDWMPPAMWALSHHQHDPAWLAQFLRKLERLGAMMLVTKSNAHERGQRIGQLLRELDSGAGLEAPSLALSDFEQAMFVIKLDTRIYRDVVVRKFVMIRLDELLSDPPLFKHDGKIITVEHVLPQNPRPDSEWISSFTPAQRQYWTHQLGNLLLLSRSKNSQAQNFDFEVKKTKYFTGKSGVSNFPLTTQVLRELTWTPQIVKARHIQLLDLLVDEWELSLHHDYRLNGPDGGDGE